MKKAKFWMIQLFTVMALSFILGSPVLADDKKAEPQKPFSILKKINKDNKINLNDKQMKQVKGGVDPVAIRTAAQCSCYTVTGPFGGTLTITTSNPGEAVRWVLNN
ncbi:hypothetical protein GWN26_14795 [Candidatus Saccharibacteria bacterium]|nr:hypothetical protein [Candidatus Saccharibacteria bacterium]NIV04456.1 hypothetical protein [Calditrichia bacterium]NIV73045.1 hypothetical protein [Calditrichia bacterium]NIW00312.1 hypothetical protein [Candidatus Saccharibacteria bacterium]NIW79098.1 hypothetical protein [Calditrichia bacterium]